MKYCMFSGIQTFRNFTVCSEHKGAEHLGMAAQLICTFVFEYAKAGSLIIRLIKCSHNQGVQHNLYEYSQIIIP